jgi:hypothetical protein
MSVPYPDLPIPRMPEPYISTRTFEFHTAAPATYGQRQQDARRKDLLARTKTIINCQDPAKRLFNNTAQPGITPFSGSA